jgi:hypothetical protein
MDSRDRIYDRLLEPRLMSDARAALIGKYEWFLHRKCIVDFGGVKDKGLEPRDQEFYGYRPSTYERRRLGENWRNIICLGPLGTTMNLHSKRFCVAIHRDHLPNNIAMDYSFHDEWKQATRHQAGPPPLGDIEVFLKVVSESGSVACYDPIPPDALKVWVKGEPKDRPETWPKIGDVESPDEWV